MPRSPAVLLISITHPQMVNEVFRHQVAGLRQNFQVVEVNTAEAAIQELNTATRYAAVLLADAHLADKNQTTFRNLVHNYVQAGGTALFCASFSCFIDGYGFERLFNKTFSLRWTRGDYCRTTFSLCTNALLPIQGLPPAFSMKAQSVGGIQAEEAVYRASAASRVESRVFAPEPIDLSKGEAPVVFKKVGDGYIGYIGDVNGELECTSILLAICRFAAARAASGSSQEGAADAEASPSDTAQLKRCDGCGDLFPKVKRCRGCLSVAYCGETCYRNHWPVHKAACRAQT